MAAASTGIIGSAIAPANATSSTDPNAATSSTAASASSVGATPAATPAPTGSTITPAPDSVTSGTASPTSAEAGYLNQLNAGATPSTTDSSSATPASTSGSNVSTPDSSSSGIVGSAMNRSASTPASSTTGATEATPATTNTTPAATPTVTATPTAAQTAATQAQIAQIYQSTFGRPPDAAGLAFWTNAAQSNPGMDLQSNIASGAQSQDQAAENSLNGTGNAGNWTAPGLNANLVQPGVDTWNATTNSWQAPAITSTGSAATYTPNLLGTPTQLNVAPNQTVQGQLANIDNPNSAIIQSARLGANQASNASGLLNSSMAISAGDTSAYNASIPIAEQDAGVYNNAAATNAAASNTFAVNNQNAINTAGQFNAGSANTLTGENIAANTSLANAGTAAQTSTANQAAQDATSQSIAQLNNTNQAQMQTQTTGAGATTVYQNALATIGTSTLTGAAKTTADANALAAYTTQMGLLGYSASQIQAQLGNGGVPTTSGAATATPGAYNYALTPAANQAAGNAQPGAIPDVSGILTGKP